MMFSGVPSVIAVYIVQHSDATTYGPRYAVATLAFGVAQVSAPQLGGFIADVSGAFTLVFVVSAVTAALGAVASWRLPTTSATIVNDRHADATDGHDTKGSPVVKP